MLLDLSNTRLVFVDMQPRILAAIQDHERSLHNARVLAKAARTLAVRVCSTEQNPSRLGSGDEELTALVDQVFAKTSFSATGSADFTQWVKGGANTGSPASGQAENGVGGQQVVIAGCETHICLLQTAIALKDEGYDVYVVADACGSRTVDNHEAGLARLRAAQCHIVTTEMVLFEWLVTADHPEFRSVQSLIK